MSWIVARAPGLRAPGVSVRLKLTFSYAGFLVLAGGLLLATVAVFLLRYVPNYEIVVGPAGPGGLHNHYIPNRSDLERAFAPRAAEAMGFLLVFGLVGGWILAGRMLAPLTRITRAARLATEGSLSHRIQLEGRKDEFRELADTFDTMLARIEAQVAEQQRFAANASHELRTPLAVTQTLLEVARDDPRTDPVELVNRLQHVNSRAIDLTEALLVLSRADQRAFTREPVDLSLIAEEATESLLPLADKRGLVIETSCDRGWVAGSHPLLLQLATNLVHNAIVHNAVASNVASNVDSAADSAGDTAGHGTVWVTTEVRGLTAVLTVENTGEHLVDDLVSTLAEPFQRGSARISTDHAGVGLGLAIVKSITRAHDGSLTLAPRPGGGLSVTVELPTARAAQAGRLRS